MDHFDQEFKEDLFNLILDNPEYQIKANSTVSTLIDNLQCTLSIQCYICHGQILKVLIYSQSTIFCVGCFCKNYRGGEQYVTVDLTKKLNDQSRWTIFQQLQIINQMSILGVENVEEIIGNINFPIHAKSVQQYLNSFIQHFPKDVSRQIQSKKKQFSNEVYKSFTESFIMCEYQVSDYFLANLHESSSAKQIRFLISYKQNQDYERDNILKSVEKLAKEYQHRSLNPAEMEPVDKKVELSDVEVENSTDEEEFRERSLKLLKDADELIKRRNAMIKNENEVNDSSKSSNVPIAKSHLIKKQRQTPTEKKDIKGYWLKKKKSMEQFDRKSMRAMRSPFKQ